jgi:hypothetical protein
LNNKILIGSIIAAAILVLVSFTSVVGYNSVESDVKVSPLFNVRSSRAIQKDGEDFTTDYVGKGNTLPFPKKDDKAIMVQNIIDRISRINDKIFSNFLKVYINNLNIKNPNINLNKNKIINILYKINENPVLIKYYFVNENGEKLKSTFGITCGCPTFDSLICMILFLILWFIMDITNEICIFFDLATHYY